MLMIVLNDWIPISKVQYAIQSLLFELYYKVHFVKFIGFEKAPSERAN